MSFSEMKFRFEDVCDHEGFIDPDKLNGLIAEVYGTREACAHALGYKADRIVYLWLDGSVRTMRANKMMLLQAQVNAFRSGARIKRRAGSIANALSAFA